MLYLAIINFNAECKVSDVTACISVLLVIVGGIFGFIQWHKNLEIKKASYINELTEKIRSDNDIKQTVYKIDYEEEWYNESFHNSGKKELEMDKTLSYFSYICYLKKYRIISSSEFKFFQYEIASILDNEQVVDYLYNIYHYSIGGNIPITFYYLLEYGRKNNFIEPDFYDPESYRYNSKYHNYIGFDTQIRKDTKRWRFINIEKHKSIWIGIGTAFFVLLPIVINLLIKLYDYILTREIKMLSIDGYFAYLGAVLGMGGTLFVLFITLNNEKEKVKEEQRLNIKPYLYCDLLNYDNDKWKINIDNRINDYDKIEWVMKNYTNNIANNIKIIDEYSEVKGIKISSSEMDKYGIQIFTVLVQDNIFLPPQQGKIWKTNFALIKNKSGEFVLKNGAFLFGHKIIYQYSDLTNYIYKGMFSFEININIDKQGKAHFFVESVNNSVVE